MLFPSSEAVRKLLSYLVLVSFLLTSVALAQADEMDVHPAPASIGTDIPLTYFGPAPSQVQSELIGPLQLLKSGTTDLEAGTITLPLYEGRMESGGRSGSPRPLLQWWR